MDKEQILKIVDRCFHMYASDFRNEAKKQAEKMIDEQLALCNVVGRSEQLPCSKCSDNGGGVTDDGWEKCDCQK